MPGKRPETTRSGSEKEGLEKQMGPALLPTPLSPARGLVFRRTFRRALGARCFPFIPASRVSGSVTGARTGIRGLPVCLSSQKLFRRSFRSRDLPSVVGPPSLAAPPGPGSLRLPRQGTGISGLFRSAFAFFSNGPLASGRNLLLMVLKDRADSDRNVGWF